jgi:cobalt-zinc-cadmium efflux system protein
MQNTPSNINIKKVKQKVETIDEIDNIHHLHVWKLDDKQTHLEAHINLKNNINMLEMMAIREKTENLLKKTFGINHITLQVGYNCCPKDNQLVKKSY